MQWMQALLQSGLPKSMWHTTQQQHLQQQQQHQPSLQPPVAAESVASPSGSMPTTSANPVQNRMQDPGLKNLAASYSSSSKPTHQVHTAVNGVRLWTECTF